MSGGYFGSSTRAQDGCIVTFELGTGEIRVERFSQLVFHRERKGETRSDARPGPSYIEQAAARADELEARILCISTPQTILTDLQGTRAPLRAKETGRDGLSGGVQQSAPNAVPLPEVRMLGKIGRADLFKPPAGGQREQHIRQVRQRRPSHAGTGEQ